MVKSPSSRCLMSDLPSNSLLKIIKNAGIRGLEPHLSTISVMQGQEIADTGGPVRLVYFPHSAVLSCVVGLIKGSAVAGGLIGKDGAFGALQVLDSMVALNRVTVIVPGVVSVIDADHLVSAVEKNPALRRILLSYEQYFLAQVQQTAACNAQHDIPMRTCRWLLRMEQLAGSNFPLTQEALALMMGVRRTSVTQIASNLQGRGLISYHRGKMKLVDVAAMREIACECHQELENHHEQVFSRLSGEADDLPSVMAWKLEKGSSGAGQDSSQ
jgi:CRP-like cAMP-binding protein